MKKIIIAAVLGLFSISCAAGTETVASAPRFSLVSETWITNWDKVTVMKDNILGTCMATYINNGVMSWPTPCNQEEFDRIRQQQQFLNQLMEGANNERQQAASSR